MKMTLKGVLTPLILALAAGMVACGEKAPPPKKLTPEEIVEQRALARWEIKKQNKTAGLYEFISPAQKQIIDKASYEGRIGSAIVYKDAEVQSVACQGGENASETADVCYVKIYIKHLVPAMNLEGGSLLEETWVLQDKQWWLSEN